MSTLQITNIEEQNTCSICLAVLNESVLATSQLRCGHLFHSQCIKAWAAKGGSGSHRLCPNCRQPLALRPPQEAQPNISTEAFSLDPLPIRPSLLAERLRGQERAMMRERLDRDNSTSDISNNIVTYIIAIIVGLAAEVVIFYFYISQCGDLFSNSNQYPFISVGSNAKGIIAIGMVSHGIISIGVLSQGLFTFSILGSGLIIFVGQIGGGAGLGLYQIGISWYCFVGQLSVSIWSTNIAQMGVNILGPVFEPENKKVLTTCD